MGSYLGIDAHGNAGLEMAAIDATGGDLLWRDRCGLDRHRLRQAVCRAPRPCTVVFEQGELATWLHLSLLGTCEELIVADPRRNRLIATSPDKADPFDALTLAQLARGKYVREVFQPPRSFLTLRLRVRHHHRLQRHGTAIKNQLKALFRQQGIPVQGTSVYSPKNRSTWLASLPGPAGIAAGDLYALLDVIVGTERQARMLLQQATRRFPPTKRLLAIPYIGPVTAATFAAYLVTPRRFPSRSHVWSYCGFGLTRRQSGYRAEPVRIRTTYNRHLKRVIKSTVERLVSHPDQPFSAAYQQRVDKGMLPRRAKLTVARKLIDVMIAMWSNQEEFDPARINIA